MACQLFVYWRIDKASLAPALVAVKRTQALLQATVPGLVTRVYERCDPAPDATVMETYEAPGGIDDAARQRIDAALAEALATLPAGPRHVEVFEPR